MRTRDQALVALLLAGTTWAGIHRIAEAKSEAAAGGGVFRLAESRGREMEAFAGVRSDLAQLGQAALADRLEALREDGGLWVAPRLDPGRWAVYVESLRMVRRIYIRQEALLRPVEHLFHGVSSDAPPRHREAFARLSLGGALAHELAHYDGLIDEAAAYERELAFYEEVRGSPFFAGLAGEPRAAYEWALDSAVLSAQAARRKAADARPAS